MSYQNVKNSFNWLFYILVRNHVPDLPETETYDQLIKILVKNWTPIKSYISEKLKLYINQSLFA